MDPTVPCYAPPIPPMRETHKSSRVDLDRPDAASEPIRNMHDVLSDRYRRAVIHYLQHHESPATVTAIARQIVEWQETTAERSRRPPESVDRVRAWLLQEHVLKMEAFGVLGYDPDADTVWIPEDITISVSPPWTRPEADADAI